MIKINTNAANVVKTMFTQGFFFFFHCVCAGHKALKGKSRVTWYTTDKMSWEKQTGAHKINHRY